MLCCLKYIWYINKKNKIIDINNEEYNKLTNTCVSHSNNSLCSKINDKYVINTKKNKLFRSNTTSNDKHKK